MDNGSVMVCVTQQYECERLIREGRKIADIANENLYVVNVQPNGAIGKKFSNETEYLFDTSKKLNAQMLVFFANDPTLVIKSCIKRYGVNAIVLGASKEIESHLPEIIKSDDNDIKIYIIG